MGCGEIGRCDEKHRLRWWCEEKETHSSGTTCTQSSLELVYGRNEVKRKDGGRG